MIDFKQYIKELQSVPIDEITEHSKRFALETILRELANGCATANKKINVLHEPKRKDNYGSPDFKIYKENSIIGYVENKKITENLDKILKTEQIKKYRELSQNLLITNYIEFVWIKGEMIQRETLCYLSDIENKKFKLDKEKAEKVEKLLLNFFSQAPEKIALPKDLALALAVRCKNLKDFINDELTRQNEQNLEESRLFQLYKAFKDNIFTELTISEFSDAFAQMLVYGFFLAGLNADTKKITIRDTKYYIPASFQLIKELLNFLDELEQPEYQETKWIIDETLSIINNIQWFDLKQNLSFNKKVKDNENIETDPYIYFYETFLATYDYNLRKSKGVYYTPPQVVNFIVRAIDEILINTFKLSNGFADRNKVTVLDFATGTGTFLLEVFKIVLENIPKESPEKRKMIIKDHILQNLFGFEYLIAPYTIAHLKLSQFLKENGYEFQEKDRLQIYLTNTLEPVDKQIKVPFMPQLSKETQSAQEIKDKPILVITGNPPYSGISKNNGTWISKQINKYKFVDGKPFGEKKHWLNDDYVKFIRFAQDKMDKAEHGIVGIITNHSFLDNPTFRGMRQSLMNTFDQLYFIDLHGNAKKKEKTPEGEKDENVFDIEQGVAISILIKKTGLKKGIFHTDFYGLRNQKYENCLNNSLNTLDFQELTPNKPFYFFVQKDETHRNDYENGWKVENILNLSSTGICSQRDCISIQSTENELKTVLNDFQNLSEHSIREKYQLEKDGRDWQVLTAKKNIIDFGMKPEFIQQIVYRPFDFRYTYFTNKSKGFIAYPRYNVLQHLVKGENFALMVGRAGHNVGISFLWNLVYIANKLIDLNIYYRGGELIYPLYLYSKDDGLYKENDNNQLKKEVNFTPDFKKFIKEKYEKEFTPEQILGYIYAILHSETYRKKYSEFLKSDFPRILFTDSEQVFEKISVLGFELIQKHLLKEIPNDKNYKHLGIYKGEGDNIVIKPEFRIVKTNEEISYKLYINKTQYFETVPENVYNFQIGGYQVLDKYLKDRKNRELSHDEIDNITNIVKALTFTIKQMKLIDKETKEWI